MPEPQFFVRSGGGDRLSRGTFFLFASDGDVPREVVKFARVPGYPDQFDADARGLELAERIGAAAAGHAPRLRARFQVAGHEASLETAAVGRALGPAIRSAGLRSSTRLGIESVAAWIVDKDAASREVASSPAGRIEELAAIGPAAAEAASRVAGTDGVVGHDDLGCWNVVADGDRFVLLDWESARADGLPLWDLWYFLADAAATADRVPRSARGAHLAELFRGGHELSALLFACTRRAADRLGLEPAAVGSLATLCWLHHARSADVRSASLAAQGLEPEPEFHWPAPDEWLADPALGLNWRAWEQAP